MDLYSKKIIGHRLSLEMDAKLVIRALREAIDTREVKEGLIVHSDMGSQYISKEVMKMLKEAGIRHSFSKKGYPYDNSPMESFNASIKKEEVYTKKYKDYETAKVAIFEYIEGYYNTQRIHSSINYNTPNEYESNYYKQQDA